MRDDQAARATLILSIPIIALFVFKFWLGTCLSSYHDLMKLCTSRVVVEPSTSKLRAFGARKCPIPCRKGRWLQYLSLAALGAGIGDTFGCCQTQRMLPGISRSSKRSLNMFSVSTSGWRQTVLDVCVSCGERWSIRNVYAMKQNR